MLFPTLDTGRVINKHPFAETGAADLVFRALVRRTPTDARQLFPLRRSPHFSPTSPTLMAARQRTRMLQGCKQTVAWVHVSAASHHLQRCRNHVLWRR